jgi:hypothetical protein
MRRSSIVILVGGILITGALAMILPAKSGSAGSAVHIGYPFPFLVQDQTRRDPPTGTPVEFLSPWEHPTSIRWHLLLVDVVLWSAALALTLILGARARRVVSRT